MVKIGGAKNRKLNKSRGKFINVAKAGGKFTIFLNSGNAQYASLTYGGINAPARIKMIKAFYCAFCLPVKCFDLCLDFYAFLNVLFWCCVEEDI